MNEQGYQAKVIKYLEAKGAYVVKTIKTSKKGVPDLLVCYKGRFIGIEMKTPTTRNNLSDLQMHNLAMISKADGYGVMCVDTEDVQRILTRIDNGN